MSTLERLQRIEHDWVMATYARAPVAFVRGEGCRLWDDAGREYLDFLSGIAVLSVGHCHPAVVAAVREQAGQLTHVGNLYYSEPAMLLAQRLAQRSLGGKVFFTNSGAEANEAALKLVRKARPGGRIIVLEGAFHGRTYGALSATPQESKQAPFAPLVPGFQVVPRDPDALAAAVDEQTAAVLLEPIQGESGVHVLDDELLHAARAACDRSGAALVFDEIQCGMGRTGTLWAYEQTGVTPDAMTLAKGLGGGLPIGALVTGPRLADVFEPGDHGSTFAGGPLVTRAALAVLDVLDDPALLARVSELGEYMAEGLRRLPRVREVRGRGLMLAIELDIDGDEASASDRDVARSAPEVVRAALLSERLVINATGPTTVRFLPPLIATEADVQQALRRLANIAW